MQYIPKEVESMNTPIQLLVPTSQRIKGVSKDTYTKKGEPFFASFKTYGGTEKESNGVIVIEDTADIVCYYNPDIKPKCHIINLYEDVEYEILGRPENINQQFQFLKFKVRAIVGGA